MNKFVIIGGGTAGWLTALTLNKMSPYADVSVISSEEIGILGAGEGVTPHFNLLMEQLNIPLEGIFENAKATTKVGIKFTNWNGDGQSYVHPFWDNKTALHFDAALLAEHLKSISIERGVKYIDGTVKTINSKSYNEDIESFELTDGTVVHTDFVFDCSGLHRLIIGKHYNSRWIDYSESLPCSRALPFFIQHDEDVSGNLYTESIAMKAGWIWKIPVQGRYGCGYVFDKRFTTDDEAKAEVRELFGDVEFPRVFDFSAGCYEKTWINNCVAIGLSSGFTEPLEATSIWVQILSLWHYIAREPSFARDRNVEDHYSGYTKTINTFMRDFIHSHYLTKRNDSEFWRTFRDTNVTPDYVKDIRSLKEVEEYHLKYLNEVYGSLYDSPIFPASWNVIKNGTS
jgi:tryptophan 7-halogenase